MKVIVVENSLNSAPKTLTTLQQKGNIQLFLLKFVHNYNSTNLFTFQPANAQDVKILRNLQQNLLFRQNATL